MFKQVEEHQLIELVTRYKQCACEIPLDTSEPPSSKQICACSLC